MSSRERVTGKPVRRVALTPKPPREEELEDDPGSVKRTTPTPRVTSLGSGGRAPPPITGSGGRSGKAPPPIGKRSEVGSGRVPGRIGGVGAPRASGSSRVPPPIGGGKKKTPEDKPLHQQNLGLPDIINTPGGKYKLEEWVSQVQNYLNTALMMIEEDQDKRNRYLDNRAMKVWINAFTHASVGYDNNYETLETLGDRALDTYFVKYILSLDLVLDSDKISNMIHWYQDRTRQAGMNDKYRMYDMLTIRKSAITDETKLKSDSFESFYGGLFTVGDMVLPGLGGVLVYNMIYAMYKDVKVETKRKDAKSEVTFMFNKFKDRDGWKLDELMKQCSRTVGPDVEGKYTFYVCIPKSVDTALLALGFDVDPSGVYGRGSGNGTVTLADRKNRLSDMAEKDAFKDALNVLEEIGFTPQRAEEIKQAGDFASLDQDLYGRALAKAKKEDITLILATPPKNVAAVRLMARLPNGKSPEIIRYEYPHGMGIKEAREHVLRLYLDEVS